MYYLNGLTSLRIESGSVFKMKIVIRLVTGFIVLALVVLVLRDQYKDHEIVQDVDRMLREHAPAILEADKLYQDVKTSVATSSISESGDKFKAWQEWYVVPEKCRKEVLGNDLVECRDHSINARQEFEALWQESRIESTR